jgi:gliding motility-associated lipoprotein GldD
MKMIKYICLLVIILQACSEETIRIPRPRMYPRVVYPDKQFGEFQKTDCAFTFRQAMYSKVVRDSFLFDGKPGSDCWFDLQVPELNASLHCSYYPITKEKTLSLLINDVFALAGKHNIKANYRKESEIVNAHGVKGILFEMEGPVASPLQFYLTDEQHHFFRASLYFNAKVDPDSTRPVLKFLRQDIDTLITSFRWKN